MGLFENLFGGNKMTVKKVERMAVENDFNGIVLVMFTEPDANVARVAGEVFRKMVWNTLCLGAGWEGLFMLGINIAAKIVTNPPLDYNRAEFAYLVYDQGFTRAPENFEFKSRPVLIELLEGVQQALLKLYLEGGDYFHNKLSDNALGKVTHNELNPLYLQKLYAQLLQEEKSLSNIITRCNIFQNDGKCFWCIYDYINKKRGNIPQKDKDMLLSRNWSYKGADIFFNVEVVKNIYLHGAPDDTGFIKYFEEQYIKKSIAL